MKPHDRYLEREEKGEWKPKAKKKKYRIYIPTGKAYSPGKAGARWLFANKHGERVLGKYHTKRDAEKALESEMKQAKSKSFSLFSVEDLEMAVIEKIKKREK